jgi:hypothetical protein
MPEIWLDLTAEWSGGASTGNLLRFVRILSDFIDELLSLQKAGMDVECFSVILEGRQEVSREAWEKIKEVAAAQHAMENCQYVQKHGHPSADMFDDSQLPRAR